MWVCRFARASKSHQTKSYCYLSRIISIELACHIVKKAAIDRAVADVDKNFAASYELRRRHRQVMFYFLFGIQAYFRTPQTNCGQPFWDVLALNSNFLANLPDPLQIQPTGVQPNQISTVSTKTSVYLKYHLHCKVL